jgi:hypothetical protein
MVSLEKNFIYQRVNYSSQVLKAVVVITIIIYLLFNLMKLILKWLYCSCNISFTKYYFPISLKILNFYLRIIDWTNNCL